MGHHDNGGLGVQHIHRGEEETIEPWRKEGSRELVVVRGGGAREVDPPWRGAIPPL